MKPIERIFISHDEIVKLQTDWQSHRHHYGFFFYDVYFTDVHWDFLDQEFIAQCKYKLCTNPPPQCDLDYYGFTRVAGGYLAYKTFGGIFKKPTEWKVKENSIIRDFDLEGSREIGCGPGINLASYDWVTQRGNASRGIRSIWQCYIPDHAKVVVPLNFNGKIRTNEIKLLCRIPF